MIAKNPMTANIHRCDNWPQHAFHAEIILRGLVILGEDDASTMSPLS